MIAVLMLVAGAGCGASTLDSSVERAKFALDNSDWNKAIQEATEALQADSGDAEAALLLSSAYAGRSGITVPDLLVHIADFTQGKDIFDIIHDTLIADTSNVFVPEDLRTSILVFEDGLDPFPDKSDVLYPDLMFQWGVLLLIEIYTLPSYTLQPTLNGLIDQDKLEEAVFDIIMDDLLKVDDKLIASGISEDDGMVRQVRRTFCILDDVSIVPGFNLAVLDDLVYCQLSPNDGADLSADNNDFISPLITSCSDFPFDKCKNAGPTE